MDAEIEAKLADLYVRAVALAPDQALALIDSECGTDADLRTRALALLDHDRTPDSADPAGGPTLEPGAQIGGYTVVRELASGGMGVVYLAEQRRPRRTVALKIIRAEHLTLASLKRFELEADLLGRLHHDGIAQVYEAGTFDGHGEFGPQPFLVMEYVDGLCVDEFLRDLPFSLPDRLALFKRICEAVHHAHERGLVHRDLKPSNIIVTAQGHPKVVDFGIARLDDSGAGGEGLDAESGKLIGTLPYMSPEQAMGEADRVDARSDVYALGVLAYKMLSGAMPYALHGLSTHDAVETICKAAPVPLRRHNPGIPEDVELVVGKALSKQKPDRYQSALELAQDIDRFLENQPILARRPTMAYHLRKSLARNRLLVVSTSIVTLSLAVGAVAATVAWARQVQLSTALDNANRQLQQQDAELIATANQLFSAFASVNDADPVRASQLRRSLLDKAAADITNVARNDPRAQARLRILLGSHYGMQGSYRDGAEQLRQALALIATLPVADAALLRQARVQYMDLLGHDGRGDQAGAVAEDILASLSAGTPLPPRDEANVLCLAAEGRVGAGKAASALALFDHAEELLRGSVLEGEGYAMLVRVLCRRGQASLDLRDFANAERDLRAAWDLGRQQLTPANHPWITASMHNLGAMLLRAERYQEAVEVLRPAIDLKVQADTAVSVQTMMTQNLLAKALGALGQDAEAESIWKEIIPRTRATQPEPSAHIGAFESAYGLFLLKRDRAEEASPLLSDGYSQLRKVLGESHSLTQQAQQGLQELDERRPINPAPR